MKRLPLFIEQSQQDASDADMGWHEFNLHSNLAVYLHKHKAEIHTVEIVSVAMKAAPEEIRALLEQLYLSGVLEKDAEQYRLGGPDISLGKLTDELSKEKRWEQMDGLWLRAWRVDTQWIAVSLDVPGIMAAGYDRAEALAHAAAFALRMKALEQR